MNKRIKILLLLGCIILAAGFMVCIAGAVISNINGDQLFAEELKDGKGYTYPLSAEDITKIEIEATDVNVNIIGGSRESRIEIINFDENMYSFSASSRLVSFKESKDLSSLLRFWESGLTFKGMRYVMRFGAPTGNKTINIYLTNTDYVKSFSINIGNGKINAEDLSKETDFRFTLNDGAVTMTNIKTSAEISVNAPNSNDCDIILNNVTATTLNISAAYAEVKSEALSFGNGKLNITHGSAKLDYIPLGEYFKLNVNANGKLTVNDVNFLSTFSHENLPPVSNEPADEETTAPTVYTVTIDGRELAVYLKGDCFKTTENNEE